MAPKEAGRDFIQDWLMDEKNEGMRNTKRLRSPLKSRETSVEVQFQPVSYWENPQEVGLRF